MSGPGNANEISGPNAHARSAGDTWAVADAGGNGRGNTYNGTDSERLQHSYEAIFGPAGRDIKHDPQRHKRHQRWHLPDNLKGRNEYLTDRIDGLITDATSSPFTRNILPYVYLESPDQKIKWNVYSFDEGMASRVPYESAARVLTQSKTSHAGYAVRQGLAIVMEHNFLASAAGMANFQNQLKQLVGSIQLTNDLDVHVALLQAASYQRTIDEKYYSESTSLYDQSKKYVDLFGIMQKIPNALDIIIEDAKNHLKTWGSQPPTFLMCPSDLTAQLQMSPERTNYITNGPDGMKRLAEGPNLPSYRGLSIIHSQKFSLEPGRKPRNVLKRKVRVAEYYWIDLSSVTSYQIYNQKKDMMVTFDRTHAAKASNLRAAIDRWRFQRETMQLFGDSKEAMYKAAAAGFCLLVRPNIEHEMLTVIAGRGGTQELGATFWGQTELACYDDAQHGIWGMSYKYHERAIVTNERNLIRMFDVAFDGYSGGMDTDIAKLEQINTDMTNDTYSAKPRYTGNSIIALHFPRYLYVTTMHNPFIRLLMQIFVPQLVDKGNDYDYSAIPSSDVRQCSDMLNAIHSSFAGRADLRAYQQFAMDKDEFDRLDAARAAGAPGRRQQELDQKLAPQRARMQQIADDWATIVVDCIKSLTESYQLSRPHEPRADLYTRILQLVFMLFRGNSVESMGPTRAQTFLTFLVAGTGDINSAQFVTAFDIILKIMLMDFHYPPGLVPATATATARLNLAPPVNAGAVLRNEEREVQVLTILLCKLHGIEVRHAGIAATDAWTYVRDGALTDHADIVDFLQMYHRETQPAQRARHDVQAGIVFGNFTGSLSNCHDLEYNLHVLQKPAFEVPNPLILSTIVHKMSQNTVVTGAEGTANRDVEDSHSFYAQYAKYINAESAGFEDQEEKMLAVFNEFFSMYNDDANNMFSVNPMIGAATYIQNNQTELAAVAYHGNLTLHKVNGVREEVRCVGHLGNSFAGCACIREGKGMVNMFQSMPTAVHVM